MEFLSEKLWGTFLAVENLCGEAMAWLQSVFPSETRPEKIEQWRLAVGNSSAAALAWFAKVFPPETRTEQISQWFHISKPYLTAATALAALVILYRYCGGGGGGGSEKTMKAPGRNYRMRRADFEGDPKGYFRDSRARK
ncbi:hypothetical protein C2S52_022406 [Perilla frutescens var. hirtella]|nr:hypothetical protein C2S52_022406 [Perilla frutescens var. hirtella]KAH6807228.1 hypothetical protein C2S51_028336 [Perilla frutescens var. frutescens]